MFLLHCDMSMGTGDLAQRIFTRGCFVDETGTVQTEDDVFIGHRSKVQIVCESISPPHYTVRNEDETLNVPAGRQNVFMCILTFLFLVKQDASLAPTFADINQTIGAEVFRQ
jgi:hypothetical protein